MSFCIYCYGNFILIVYAYCAGAQGVTWETKSGEIWTCVRGSFCPNEGMQNCAPLRALIPMMLVPIILTTIATAYCW